MTVQATQSPNRYLERPAPSSLADVVEIILDKGLVIDIYVRVSLVGIELLTIDARIVVASVDTYLRFAEATTRLDLYEHGGEDLDGLLGNGVHQAAKGKPSGAIEGIKEAFTGDDKDDDERRRRPAKKAASRRRRSESE